jgi:hypothetical protein
LSPFYESVSGKNKKRRNTNLEISDSRLPKLIGTIFSREKALKNWATSEIDKKLPEVNNHANGGNSSNLVILRGFYLLLSSDIKYHNLFHGAR